MKQSEIDRRVCVATGESRATIKRLGFLLADPIECSDPDSEEYGPQVLDWDDLEILRYERDHHGPRQAALA